MARNRSGATAPAVKGNIVVGTGTDTSAVLAVGANGTTLVADSTEATGLKWATPASGGGMTLLSTTAMSGTSTTVSSISGSYKHLLVIIRNAYVSSSGSNIDLRFNGDTGSNYVNNTMYAAGTGTPASSYNNPDSSLQFIIGIGSSSAALNSSNVVFNIYRYTENETKFINGQARGATNQNTNFTGAWNNTSAINEINFNTGISAGGGTIYIYGVN